MFRMDYKPDAVQEWIDVTRRFAGYRGELVEAMRWFGQACVDKMVAGHPPGGPHAPDGAPNVYGENAYIDRTGWLTDSIGFELAATPSWDPTTGTAPALPTLTIFATAPHADAVEYGTGTSRPFPFFFSTIYLLLPELTERIAAIMARANDIRAN